MIDSSTTFLFFLKKKKSTQVDAYLNSPNHGRYIKLSEHNGHNGLMDISFSHSGLLDSLDRLQGQPCDEAAVENW